MVSPGTAVAFFATFAERVRKAVELARLSVQGQMVAVTVSIGLASMPVDQVTGRGAVGSCRSADAGGRASGGNRTELAVPAGFAADFNAQSSAGVAGWLIVLIRLHAASGRAGSAVVAVACSNE